MVLSNNVELLKYIYCTKIYDKYVFMAIIVIVNFAYIFLKCLDDESNFCVFFYNIMETTLIKRPFHIKTSC